MDSIKEKIIEIVNTSMKKQNDGFTFISLEKADDDLSLLGMDSITFINIIVSLEEAFEIEVPDEKLLITEMGTINKLITVVSSVLEITEKTE